MSTRLRLSNEGFDDVGDGVVGAIHQSEQHPEMRIFCTERLAFILRALQALLEIVLISMRLFIAISSLEDLMRGTKRSNGRTCDPK
jgi:hypothetical protein